MCKKVMATVRKATQGWKPTKEVELINNVIDMSVTVSFKGANVTKFDIEKLNMLLNDYCLADVVALERDDIENRLHFQMVFRAQIKLALSFDILIHKYMGWYNVPKMNLVGHVCNKVFTNRLLHTFHGMIGYYLKEIGIEHSDVALHNISNEDIMEAKLYMQYLVI